MAVRHLLHVGCGVKGNKIPHQYAACKEVRLDINRLVEPDVVASAVSMPMIDDNSFDVVYCSHILEHLFAHEVAMACAEFARILKPGGEVMILCPDLQSIGGKIALDQLDMTLYQSGVGPVSALDMLYGHRASIANGNTFWAHKTGFTQSVLKGYLDKAGFVGVQMDREVLLELKATAKKPVESNHAVEEPGPKIIPLCDQGCQVG